MSKQTPPAVKSKVRPLPPGVKPRTRSREDIVKELCGHLEAGGTLKDACKLVKECPTPASVLAWMEQYPDLAKLYASARAIGYNMLAEEIIAISDEKDVAVRYEGEEAVLALDSTGVARNRLRVDTRKWILSKMLPKVYGDKVTTELTGAGGGPIQMAALSLNNLSSAELAQMEAMLKKTNPQLP
jgi:hypothetical protein